MTQDFSFGVIPLRKEGEIWQVLLIQHLHARYWGFPKGHPEAGESPLETAKRELKEETDLEVFELLSETSYDETYTFIWQHEKIFKTVAFFPAIVKGIVSLQAEEISSFQWVPLKTAFQELTYENDKMIITKIINDHFNFLNS